MLMGLEFIDDNTPILAPIKTPTPSETVDETTPKSEECRLRPALVCPPAPRKPRPAKRKAAAPPPQGFYRSVPRDLSSVFVPVSIRRPQCKRIRVDCWWSIGDPSAASWWCNWFLNLFSLFFFVFVFFFCWFYDLI